MFGLRGAAVGAVDKALPKIVERAVNDTVDRVMPGMILNVMKRIAMEKRPLKSGFVLTRAGFVWEVAFEFIRNGMGVEEARDEAAEVVMEFLKDEGVDIGHPDYDWGQEGARDIAREAMQYWEN